MENEALIQEVTAKAQKWLTPAYDAETQAEVRRMLEIWSLEPVACAASWA